MTKAYYLIETYIIALDSKWHWQHRTFHVRTTILPSERDMPAVMASFKKFNDDFMAQYSDSKAKL